MQLISNQTRQQLNALHSEAARELAELETTLGGCGVDTRLLALCGDFFDAELDGRTWTPPRKLTDLESGCIELCKQFTASVSDMRSDQVAPLAAKLDPDQLYNLMSAIYLVESSKRLDMTLSQVLE